MKGLISLLVLCLSFFVSGQPKTDNWFIIENERIEGYLNYSVVEDSVSINTDLEFKLKIKNSLLYCNAQINSKKDTFLTVKSFVIKGTTDDIGSADVFTLSGTVTANKAVSIWKVKENDRKIETKHPTIADWNLFHVLTTLDYSKKGRIIEFNSMEISELNYKENHYLDYVADETILVNNKKVLARKVTHNGDGSGESTFWLDFDNKLIKISIDNRKNFVRCKKEDINFKAFN